MAPGQGLPGRQVSHKASKHHGYWEKTKRKLAFNKANELKSTHRIFALLNAKEYCVHKLRLFMEASVIGFDLPCTVFKKEREN